MRDVAGAAVKMSCRERERAWLRIDD